MSGGRLLLLVTGASRGFGRCVAEEFVRQAAPTNPIDLVLVARSEVGLQSASDSVDEIAKKMRTADGVADVVVRREAMDLGDLDHLEASLEGLFSRIDPLRYSRAVLINNAGSLGRITFANELPALDTFRSEVDFNVTSALWLSSRFAALFGAKTLEHSRETPSSPGEGKPVGDKEDVEGVKTAIGAGAAAGGNGGSTRDVSNNVVVNISSLAALQTFEAWSGYCSGKAARDMFHRVLATEQASIGGLKVLNYAPGPMNTDMAREIRTAEQFEEEVQSGKLIDPRVSAEKCARLALRGTFESGSHIDYFDEEN